MTSFQTNLPDGVLAASVTPLKKDFTIDKDALVRHCNWLFENGNNGICLMGTTGEANSFSIEDRMEALDHILENGIPADRLVVGTGCCALTDTVRLTKHAVSRKVGGVLMLPPYYYKQITDEGLAKYFSLVIDQVADDALKIYLYHFPKMTGVPFTLPLIKHLVKTYPNTIVGMKDSGGDWANMKAVLEAIPGFKLYAGTEKYFLEVLRAGGAGCISATTNLTGNIAANVYQQKDASSVNKLQEKLSAARDAFEGFSFIAAVKQVLSQKQNNTDWLNIRPPNSNLTAEQVRSLEDRLANVSLFTK